MTVEFVTFHAFGALPSAPDMTAEARKASEAERLLMLSLLGRSARLHHPGAVLTLLCDDAARTVPGFATAACAARPESLMLDRAVAQQSYVDGIELSDPVALLDSDILVNDNLEPLFTEDFDVGLTWRSYNRREPINGGVILLNNRRPQAVRQFFRQYLDIYRSRYLAGAKWNGDQQALRDFAALGDAPLQAKELREIGGVRVMFLPCETHNFAPENCAEAIATKLEGKKLLHFKGPRKWLMPLYWDRHMASTDTPGQASWVGQARASDPYRDGQEKHPA